MKAQIEEGYLEEPEFPDILSLYNRMKQTGVQYWQGGLADQPHILAIEIGIVENSIAKIKRAMESLSEIRRPRDADAAV